MPHAVALDLDASTMRLHAIRAARACVYTQPLRELLERKQINVVRALLGHWCAW